MPLQVIPVTTDDQLQRAFALRVDVFITEQKFSGVLEVDAYDSLPTTRQFLGMDTDTGKFVATARCVVFANDRRGKIGRVAVLPECRGKNFGVSLMAAVEAAMQDQCDSFELLAQCDKSTFYEKCGYTRVNDEVEFEEGIAHCRMRKSIKA